VNETSQQWTRIGVCYPNPTASANRSPGIIRYDSYCLELIRHAGFLVDEIPFQHIAQVLPLLSVFITAGEVDLKPETRQALQDFVQRGGTWIAIGSTCDMDSLFGVQSEPNPFPYAIDKSIPLGEGYVHSHEENSLIPSSLPPLRFFGGIAVQNVKGEMLAVVQDIHQSPTNRAAIVRSAYGQGYTLLFAVHLGETVARIQHGRPVMEDGVPPSDGSAPLQDGVLRSEDGIMLDWHFDRMPSGQGYPYFHAPVADLWREVLIRAILQAAQHTGGVCPVIWYYPRNLEGVGMLFIRQEPDLSDAEAACARLMTLIGVRGVWGVQDAGQSAQFYRELYKRENEIALIFEPESAAFCKHTTLQAQLDHARRFSGLRNIHAVQVNGLRWQGQTEFYEHCERTQIMAELGRGGYAPGAAGFSFGSCHPWRPLKRDGATAQTYVLPLLGYQVIDRLPVEIARAMTTTAARHHGIVHFAISPAIAIEEEKADALLRLIALAREHGMEWLTASEIVSWEEGRRQLRYKLNRQGDSLQMALVATKTMNHLSLMLLSPHPLQVNTGVNILPTTTVQRYGFTFHMVQVDVIEKSVRELSLAYPQTQAA
jgi:hypothetical protein